MRQATTMGAKVRWKRASGRLCSRGLCRGEVQEDRVQQDGGVDGGVHQPPARPAHRPAPEVIKHLRVRHLQCGARAGLAVSLSKSYAGHHRASSSPQCASDRAQSCHITTPYARQRSIAPASPDWCSLAGCKANRCVRSIPASVLTQALWYSGVCTARMVAEAADLAEIYCLAVLYMAAPALEQCAGSF